MGVALDSNHKRDYQIYSEMGGAEELVADLVDSLDLHGDISGTKCYKLTDDRTFYEDDGGSYAIDKGVIFTLLGYEYTVNGENRYYINVTTYLLK